MTVAATRMYSRTRWLDSDVEPLRYLGPGGFAWQHEEAAFATSGEVVRIALAAGTSRLPQSATDVGSLLAAIESDDAVGLPGTGPIAVGAIPFLGGGELVVPARVVGRTEDGYGWETRIGPDGSDGSDGQASMGPTADLDGRSGGGLEPSSFVVESDGGRLAWTAAVSRALERIERGELEKVVLARRVTVWGDQPFRIPVVADRLRGAHPSCFTFVAGGFVGASPELLVRRRGRWASAQPMAGTVARGGSRADDRRLAASLRSSPKELDEHRLVVEDVRRRLATVCSEVHVKGPQLVGLSSVTHLATSITGRLAGADSGLSALGLAGVLHPTPAVGGEPREAALALIAELEGFDRGCYAGPVGWVDRRGDGDWAVALRCALIEGRRAHLTAGAGIVAGSAPESEWAETQSKLEPMLRALVRV